MRLVPQSGVVCVNRPCACHLQQQQSWSSHRLSPALVAAARLLQQQPHLAAAPALTVFSTISSNISSSSLARPGKTIHHALGYLDADHSWQQQRQLHGLHSHKQQQEQRSGLFLGVSSHGAGQSLVCSNKPSYSATACCMGPADVGEANAAATAAAAAAGDDGDSKASEEPAAQGPSSSADAAAAALARLQQASQKIQNSIVSRTEHQSAAAAAEPGSSANGRPTARQPQQLIKPSTGHESALQQIEQKAPSKHHQQDRLLTWRNRKQQLSQQPLQQQSVLQQQPLQQQQQLPAPPLEPSIDPSGKTYLTSPVSFVAADTSTKALAGSISAAFAVHQHQLMFAVGPLPLSVAMKALATARIMMAAGNDSRPVNILMQPTLRGGRTVRNQSYALDIARVGDLPMQPGGSSSSSSTSTVTYGVLQQQQDATAGSSRELSVQQQQQQEERTDVKIVHITSTSNEWAAARSLVENMPARGQTVIRVAGPFATETAVLAVALSRPLFRQKYGQDLAACVLWNANKKYNNKQSGLLLAVFRCAVDVFPPEVLLLPPSQRKLKKQQYWLQQQQRRQGKKQQQQQVG